MKANLLTFLALAAIPSLGFSQTTYTWTGSAADGDWTNALNWDANGVPVEDIAGDNFEMQDTNKIVIDVSNPPTINVPIFGGTYDASNDGSDSSPAIEFIGTGSMSITQQYDVWTNRDSTSDRYIWKVGSDATITQTGDIKVNRHGDGTHRFLVEGTLNFEQNLNMSHRPGTNSLRNSIFELNGGIVNVTGNNGGSGAIYNAGEYKYFEFQTVGSEVNAHYGAGSFLTFADVQAAVGPTGAFRSADPLNIGLEAIDNGGGSYTVRAVDPPSPNYWTGNGSSVLGDSSNNFTLNNADEVLNEGTLADVIALPADDKAYFGDEYFFSNTSAAVNTSTLTTVAGGVTIADLDFYNNLVDYSIDSPDSIGITGATNLNLWGSGEITLTGDHTTTGTTTIGSGATLNLGDGTTEGTLANSPIVAAGTIVYNVSGTANQTQTITGAGTLEKRGSGSLIVADGVASGHSGATNIVEGTATFTNNYGSNNVDIASGTTLELNITSFVNAPATTFTGTGTLLKTGTEQIRWSSAVLNVDLGSGALIDVQEGTFRAGSNANDVWEDNLADLNVAAGATFNTHEANVYVDAITGEGNIGSGYNGAGYENLTIGVDNGSGSFSGVIYDQDATVPCTVVKTGTGEQILNGENTFTGDLIVEDGTLTLGDSGKLNFIPTANGVTTGIKAGDSSGGTVNLEGQMYIDLSNAAAGIGNSWTLVDVANLTAVNYNAFTFWIDSSLGSFSPDFSGKWQLEDGIALWTYDESTGILTYDVTNDARLWTGLVNGTWDQSTTTNFMNNQPSDPVAQTTFDGALALTGTVGFADIYFNSGNPVSVGTSDITIASGGVIGNVAFFNNTTPYVVTSSDANGIAGTSNVSVTGTGSVTFIGDFATTGVTTLGAGSTLTFEATTAPGSYASGITGGGNIEKTGPETVTLTADNSYTGSTTITAGTLKVTNNSDTTSVTIASGATLEMDFNNRWGATTTYSGDGTILKTGTSTINFWGGTFALGADALIDVQEGQFTGSTGGSGGSENWTANMSDLYIAGGAKFHGAEGNIRIDALDGDGTFATGFNGAGYVTTTIGVGNGDGTFNGTVEDTDVSLLHFGNIIKTGTGTQTFGGDCTIHGNLTVEDGTLTLADTGSITFYPTSNGVSNQVLGVDNGTGVGNGTVNANGAINIDLSNADPGWGNSWLLVDDTYLTVVPGATLTVTSPDGAFSEDTPGVWTLDTGGNLWTFTVATGTLSVSEGTAVAGYSDWADFYFDLLDTDPTLDYDGGGLETGIEYVVGGDPSIASDDNGLTPTGVVDASGNLIFTFRRSDLANEDPNTDIIVEYGSDLTGWTAAEDGVDGVTVTVNDDAFVSDYPGDPSTVDEVIVTLPASLANGDKIFARLRAEIDSL